MKKEMVSAVHESERIVTYLVPRILTLFLTLDFASEDVTKKKGKYEQRFRPAWKAEFSWLTALNDHA